MEKLSESPARVGDLYVPLDEVRPYLHTDRPIPALEAMARPWPAASSAAADDEFWNDIATVIDGEHPAHPPNTCPICAARARLRGRLAEHQETQL